MTCEQFIEMYDHPGSIILLEGKRIVADSDKDKLVSIGKLLAENSKHIIFRSGNASGSDLYFSEGVAKVDSQRLEVITPYEKHRVAHNIAGKTISLDKLDLSKEQKILDATRLNPKHGKFVDSYLAGVKNRFTVKVAYILRDTIKALGTTNIAPITAALFYDDLQKPLQGGTGHTMNVCKTYSIPLFNQTVWFDWVK